MQSNGLGGVVKELREARGWTPGELAAKAGVSRQRVSHVEKGVRKNPRLDFVVGVANAFELDVRVLLVAAGYPLLLSEGEAEIDLDISGFFSGVWREATKEEKALVRNTIHTLGEIIRERKRQYTTECSEAMKGKA